MNRKFDNTGRLVIPKEMRDKLGLTNDSEVKIELVGNKIIISNPNEFNLKKYIEERMNDNSLDESAKIELNNILEKI